MEIDTVWVVIISAMSVTDTIRMNKHRKHCLNLEQRY